MSGPRPQLGALYSTTGRPSIPPEQLLKVLLLEPIGNLPPAEAEKSCYAMLGEQ